MGNLFAILIWFEEDCNENKITEPSEIKANKLECPSIEN